jgi:hypothetical protein
MYIYAGTLGKLGKTEEKIAVLNDIISAFGHHTRVEIVEPLTRAIFTLGKLLWMLGRQNEALDTLKTAETYCDIKDEAVLANIVHALWGRAFYLEMLNKGDDEIRASKFGCNFFFGAFRQP